MDLSVPDASVTMERVLCAAIWVDDGLPHPYQPMSRGVVLCGYRHHQIFQQAALLRGVDRHTEKVQGFLTDQGRFVDRFEAFRLAEAAGQLEGRKVQTKGTLFSEDLY